MTDPKLSPSQAAVLRELQALGEHPWGNAATGGWWRAFHVRWFRGAERTDPEVQALTIPQVESRLRALAAKGLVQKRPGAAEFKAG